MCKSIQTFFEVPSTEQKSTDFKNSEFQIKQRMSGLHFDFLLDMFFYNRLQNNIFMHISINHT